MTITRPEAHQGLVHGAPGAEQAPTTQGRTHEVPSLSDGQMPPKTTQPEPEEHGFLRRHWKSIAAAGTAVLTALGYGFASSNGLGNGTPEQLRPTASAPAVPGANPSATVETSGTTAPNTIPAAGGEFDPDKVAALSPEGKKQLFSINPGDIDPKDPTSYTNKFAKNFCGAIKATVNQRYTKEEDYLTTGSPEKKGFPGTKNIFVPAMSALTGGLDITEKNPALVGYVNSQTERVWYAAVAAMGSGENTGQVVECTVDPTTVTENSFTFTVEEKNDLKAILKENAQLVRYVARVTLGDHFTDGGRVVLTDFGVKNR